ncbi:hypothetical protein C8R45DRAFT_1057447 [Mycena sanguinolenta]|nr:hypothetical protein C8R45DRAFT_1057447 [Mycena sanguinolenta]
MTLSVSLVPVNLATVAVESCLYVTAICLLLGRNAILDNNCGKITIFILHWVITIDRAFVAFIHFSRSLGPLGFYADLSELTEVVKTGFLMATGIIADGLIAYSSSWVVWSYNKKILIFPIATLVGLAVSSTGLTYQFTQYRPGKNVFLSSAGRWITSATVFTLCAALYTSEHHASTLRAIVLLTVPNRIWSGFYLVAYQSQSNFQFTLIDCLPAITGISCMLIHVRVGMGWVRTGGDHSSTLPGTQLSLLSTSHAFDTPICESETKCARVDL